MFICFQSDVLRKDDIYIEDDLEGSGGGNREFNKDDLEASGSGYGPDDEDASGSGDNRECICCLFFKFLFCIGYSPQITLPARDILFFPPRPRTIL